MKSCSKIFCILTISVVAVLFEIANALPLVSQYYFLRAQKSEHNLHWRDAETLYAKAVFFSPFDAQYTTSLANFILRRNLYLKNKTKPYKRAQKLYRRARRLNPSCAEYAVTLGQLQIQLFLLDPKIHHKELTEGIKNLQGALASDPYGVNICYLAGYSSISVWNFLDEKQKNLILEKLRYALTYRPWYAGPLYHHLWQAQKDFTLLQRITPNNLKVQKKLYDFLQKNNLWQYRRLQLSAVNTYRKKEDPWDFQKEQKEKQERLETLRAENNSRQQDAPFVIIPSAWRGHSQNGAHTYKDGNMYWAGTMDGILKIPEGAISIVIQAKATPSGEVYPYMIVELDGEEIGETTVDSRDWKDYSFDMIGDGKKKILSITYANDQTSKNTREDMNLYIGRANAEQQ